MNGACGGSGYEVPGRARDIGEAVAWVARALPSRPVVPVLSGLLLEAEATG